MSDLAGDPLSLRLGRATVAENLERAIHDGHATRTGDGMLVLRARKDSSDHGRRLFSDTPWPFPCQKLTFLFLHAYDCAQIPWTCRNCYKVKASPRTLRELAAVHEITAHKPYSSKYGPEVEAIFSSDLYGAFFYADGLEQARVVYRDVRAALDADERVKDVPLRIKRGCTDFEVHCGRSDQYAFPPGLAKVEEYLLPRLVAAQRPPNGKPPQTMVLMRWVQAAYQVGDETYRDFTGGRRLFPETVSYAP